MNPERDKLIDKLRKLFALGQSSNQHEAELAMQKANELMQAHQIAATDIDFREAGQIRTEDVTVDSLSGVRHWVYILCRASAFLYDGEAMLKSGSRSDVMFVGNKSDIEAMKMTHQHLFSSWKSIVEHDLDRAKAKSLVPFTPAMTMKFKHGHGVGYSQAIMLRVQELVRERQVAVQAKTATGNSLVVVKNQAVSQYMAGNSSTKKTNSSSGSMAGVMAGHAAGNKVPLGGIEKRSNMMIGAS
jgi:hypothetical protein